MFELRELKHERAKLKGNVRKLKTDLGRTSVAVEKHLAVYTAAEVEMKETGILMRYTTPTPSYTRIKFIYTIKVLLKRAGKVGL